MSEDGLTWTISIKQGVHYAPPFDNVEITAGDFIRAMEREADPAASSGGYSFYYSAIEGFDDFGAGKAEVDLGHDRGRRLHAPDQGHGADGRPRLAHGDAGHRADPAE